MFLEEEIERIKNYFSTMEKFVTMVTEEDEYVTIVERKKARANKDENKEDVGMDKENEVKCEDVEFSLPLFTRLKIREKMHISVEDVSRHWWRWSI